MADQPFCHIYFQLANKSIRIPKGTLIIDAAGLAGVTLNTPCGGEGRCGRCIA